MLISDILVGGQDQNPKDDTSQEKNQQGSSCYDKVSELFKKRAGRWHRVREQALNTQDSCSVPGTRCSPEHCSGCLWDHILRP